LVERGLFVKELNIGWQEWIDDGLPTEVGAPKRASA
jgi:3-mercaptopyruvate sulfurtransferase SseA